MSNKQNRTKSKRAWLLGGSVLSVAMLGYGSMTLVGLLAHERHSTHKVITTPVRLVDISSGAGWVHIVGSNEPTVTVDTSVSEGLFASSHHETVEGDRLVVRSSCSALFNTFCKVNYTVHLPLDTTLKVSSSGGGVSVSNVNGALDLSSSGGGIHVTGGSGSMHLSSSGGGIGAVNLTSSTVNADSSGGGIHLGFQQPPANVKVSSSGGGVTVDVPQTSDTYRVDASSSGGSTSNRLRTDPASPRSIRARSSGGGIHLNYLP
jgi:hypothetical protein